MEKQEIKKCVGEIIDKLYDNIGFYNWWDTIDVDTENEIIKELEKIVEKRFNKINDQNECPDHPNDETYISITGNKCCYGCLNLKK